ncbi:MAG: lytic transglycosylase domain-containing protein [Pseudomonadota bacterium]
MRLQRIFLNLLLAFLLALPLAALENGACFSKNMTVSAKPDWKAFLFDQVSLADSTAPALVDLVGKKTDLGALEKSFESRYDAYIEKTARLHEVSPALVKALIQVESNFDPRAVSDMGAMGLMQVMPATARTFGIKNPLEPEANILAGIRYLKTLLLMFEDDEALALAAYNSGPANVRRFGGVPPFVQTKLFVTKVMYYYRTLLDS